MVNRFSIFKCITVVSMSLMLVLSGCSKANDSAPSNDAPASASASAPAPEKGEKVTLSFAYNSSDISETLLKEYEVAHPNVKILKLNVDLPKMMAMYAAGNPPDVLRVNAFAELPTYVSRGMLLPIDEMIATSSLIKLDDAYNIIDMFKWDGKKQGVGSLYGLPKDWGPDTGMWVNNKVFKDAGLPIIAPGTILTFDQISEYANKLKKEAKGQMSVYGFTNWVGERNMTDTLLTWYKMRGGNWWDESGLLLDTPEFKELVQYYVDNAKTGAFASPLFPPTGWEGDELVNGKSAMFSSGFWYSGMIRSGKDSMKHLSDFVYLPAPQVAASDKRNSLDDTAVGYAISKGSKHPKEAFEFLEWLLAGKPADERAKSGWGLPIWKSKMGLVPEVTEFDKQTKAAALDELTDFDPQNFYNPYVSPAALDSLFKRELLPVMQGKKTIDEAITAIQKDGNVLVSEGKEIAGIE